MASYSYYNFVRSTDLESTAKTPKKIQSLNNGESGQDIKNFYESIVGLSETEEGSSKDKDTKTTKQQSISSSASTCKHEYKSSRKRKASYSKEQGESSDSKPDLCHSLHAIFPEATINGFFKSVQEGDLKLVKDYVFKQGMDLNIQDQYGWTALMCATQAGHVDIVEFLLWQEANMFICDNKGISALDLAKKNHKHTLVHMLTAHINGETYKQKAIKERLEKSQKEYSKFYCGMCKKHFGDCTRESHETSTIHLFNKKLPVKSTSYLIPESNKGFQLLVKSGWDQEKGLGSDGQGHKYPVKTVLKRDRKGLDETTKGKARITHFQPHDTSAVKTVKQPSVRHEKAATISKRAAAKKLSKEREFEKKYRMEFHME